MENTNKEQRPWEVKTPIFSEEYLKKENEKYKAERKRLYTLELVKALTANPEITTTSNAIPDVNVIAWAMNLADECEKAGLLV